MAEPSTRKKFWCWIGLHDFRYVGNREQVCRRCGKEEVWLNR